MLTSRDEYTSSNLIFFLLVETLVAYVSFGKRFVIFSKVPWTCICDTHLDRFVIGPIIQ